MKTQFLRTSIVALLLLSFASQSQSVFAQGVLLRSFGAVNESVGSVATGMPLDAGGALYWNPASISALEKNEMSIGLGIILPETNVKSSVIDPLGNTLYSGSTTGSAGSVPVPTMSFVWRRCPKSPVTFGLGMGAVGGAASLYAADTPGSFNPVLGGRSKSATVVVLQLTPTVSYQVTDKLSIGAAPLIDLASLQINPMQLGQPLGATNEIHNYGTRYAWGGGFQIGAFYDFKNHFKVGFMYKSPIWAEPLSFEGTTVGTGAPVSGSFELDLPTTLSMGFSYDGFKNTVFGMDFRYIDYGHAQGFKQGVDTNGIVKGLDWESVFSIAIGVERTINQKLKVRMGYVWNENPIPDRSAALNVAAPLMMKHTLSLGATYIIQKNLEFTLAYSHVFEEKSTGSFPTGNALLTGSVTNTAYADAIMAGISKKW